MSYSKIWNFPQLQQYIKRNCCPKCGKQNPENEQMFWDDEYPEDGVLVFCREVVDTKWFGLKKVLCGETLITNTKTNEFRMICLDNQLNLFSL